MKKRFLLFALLLCGCFALTSCEKTPDEPTDGIDRSLAGSMLVSHAILKAEGMYDGKSWIIPGGDVVDCWMSSEKVSDTEQRVEYEINWSETPCDVIFPALPLIGEPYVETMFYHTCDDAIVKLKGVEYTNVHATVKGWIKKVSTESPQEYTAWVNGDGLGPDYTCDIEGECTFNGKELKFHITELRRSLKY